MIRQKQRLLKQTKYGMIGFLFKWGNGDKEGVNLKT